jgi:hypothetical protein
MSDGRGLACHGLAGHCPADALWAVPYRLGPIHRAILVLVAAVVGCVAGCTPVREDDIRTVSAARRLGVTLAGWCACVGSVTVS